MPPQTKRPTTSPALAFASQRVWHGQHANKSKLPTVVTKDVPTVPPEVRRKRAVDAFFEKQEAANDAQAKRELKPGGSTNVGGKPRGWSENPMQRFRLKHGIFDPEDAASCYYIRQSKEVHAVQLPSYKTDCPRNCEHGNLTTNPNETGGAPQAADTNSFFVEPLTRLGRERWDMQQKKRADCIARHESRYPMRRLRDRSAATLDNQFRQELDPNKPTQTVMASVLGGTFYDSPPRNKNRVPTTLAPNFVNMNKKFVRSASDVVGMCRSRGAM